MPINPEDLEAYLKLRRAGEPVTLRGFQRLMGYSSPGKAERVLKRLERLGLVEKTPSSGYLAKRELPPELASYLVIKGLVIPRSLVYAVYSTVVAVTYAALASPPVHVSILLAAVIAPFWVETLQNTMLLKRVLPKKVAGARGGFQGEGEKVNHG